MESIYRFSGSFEMKFVCVAGYVGVNGLLMMSEQNITITQLNAM